MTDFPQELMSPSEAAKWFRRSVSWLRQQQDLVRLGAENAQPLYHVRVCRAFVFARMFGLPAQQTRRMQLAALAQACGLPADAVEPATPTPAPAA